MSQDQPKWPPVLLSHTRREKKCDGCPGGPASRMAYPPVSEAVHICRIRARRMALACAVIEVVWARPFGVRCDNSGVHRVRPELTLVLLAGNRDDTPNPSERDHHRGNSRFVRIYQIIHFIDKLRIS